MGVPGFFLWLWKNYKQSHFVFQKEKLLIKDTEFIKNNNKEQNKKQTDSINKYNEEITQIISEINEIDYFLIDTNCLIHPMCFKTLADNPDITNIDKLEEKMINTVLEYITKLVNYVKPKKGVYPRYRVMQNIDIRFSS